MSLHNSILNSFPAAIASRLLSTYRNTELVGRTAKLRKLPNFVISASVICKRNSWLSVVPNCLRGRITIDLIDDAFVLLRFTKRKAIAITQKETAAIMLVLLVNRPVCGNFNSLVVRTIVCCFEASCSISPMTVCACVRYSRAITVSLLLISRTSATKR